MILNYFRSTRAGATATAAVAVAVISIAATGLLIDHLWLVGKRDMLKNAADAAALAATPHLSGLPRSMGDGAVRERLQRTAERYARINVRDNRVEPEEIIAHLDINRGAGVVEARVEADIGYVLAGWLHNYAGPGEMAQSTGTQSVRQPLSLVLAIDENNSMDNRLDGRWAHRGERSRMEIVRGAATHMVEIVTPDPGTPVKVGLVPWSIDLGTVLEPSTDPAEIRRALAALDACGQGTRSFVGLAQARGSPRRRTRGNPPRDRAPHRRRGQPRRTRSGVLERCPAMHRTPARTMRGSQERLGGDIRRRRNDSARNVQRARARAPALRHEREPCLCRELHASGSGRSLRRYRRTAQGTAQNLLSTQHFESVRGEEKLMPKLLGQHPLECLANALRPSPVEELASALRDCFDAAVREGAEKAAQKVKNESGSPVSTAKTTPFDACGGR